MKLYVTYTLDIAGNHGGSRTIYVTSTRNWRTSGNVGSLRFHPSPSSWPGFLCFDKQIVKHGHLIGPKSTPYSFSTNEEQAQVGKDINIHSHSA